MSNDNDKKSLAENEDAAALDKLAEIYLKGLGGVEQSPKKALEFLHRAAALGEWRSYKLLGEIYLNCEGGIEADGYKVIDYLLKYAEATQRQMTDAEDIFAKEEINEVFKIVADIYLCGKCGVTQDAHKAIEYLAKAESWFDIALIYQEGKAGIKQDFCKAIEFYTKAGDKSSIEELTEIMNRAKQPPQTTDELDDEETEPDYSELAHTYKEGIGVKQNGQKALEYLIRDFEENPGWESEHEILQIYLYGCGELKPDWHKAFEFMNVYPDGGLLIGGNMLESKFACVFDDKLGYFRKDGLATLAALEARYNRLEKLKAPKFIMANELRRAAEIYEEGFGGLEPNREKSIEFYKQCIALVPKDKVTKGRLAYLTGAD